MKQARRRHGSRRTPPRGIVKRMDRPPRGWLNVKQAAKLYGVSETCIRQHCQAGRLPAIRLASIINPYQWFVKPPLSHEVQAANRLAKQHRALARLPLWYRMVAAERLRMLDAYARALGDRPMWLAAGKLTENFRAAWNRKNPAGRIAAKTIRLRLARYRREGVKALIDGRRTNGRMPGLRR